MIETIIIIIIIPGVPRKQVARWTIKVPSHVVCQTLDDNVANYCLNFQEPVCLRLAPTTASWYCCTPNFIIRYSMCSSCLVILHVDYMHMSISDDNGNRNMSFFAV